MSERVECGVDIALLVPAKSGVFAREKVGGSKRSCRNCFKFFNQTYLSPMCLSDQ